MAPPAKALVSLISSMAGCPVQHALISAPPATALPTSLHDRRHCELPWAAHATSKIKDMAGCIGQHALIFAAPATALATSLRGKPTLATVGLVQAKVKETYVSQHTDHGRLPCTACIYFCSTSYCPCHLFLHHQLLPLPLPRMTEGNVSYCGLHMQLKKLYTAGCPVQQVLSLLLRLLP